MKGELQRAAEEEVEGEAVVMLTERRLAVSQWLLTAADDREVARSQWADQGIALLCCGGVLSAMRIPARLVWAAARTDDLNEVDGFLRRFFSGGAVFMDLHAQLYYVLVGGATRWPWRGRDFPEVGRLGRDTFLGVPATHLTEPRGRSYWCVPMESPGALTYMDEVGDLCHRGRAALAEVGAL
ncbi:hypothetical protein [Streptomyces sp. Root369]|uniref:hypothetical protein n=1 Tax=Streptomyces sp. Root369 TaxID=1736523 RepID=UPI001301584C|nr:hypothetical protein [Streptomyces sp. Root369]